MSAKGPHHRPDSMTILAEMNWPSDRAGAIVAAAFVENNLSMALMARFRDFATEDREHIFENRGVLSDFASKIDMDFALGIFGPLVRKDLDRIRKIRNAFAHKLEVRDFDHAEIAGIFDALHGPKYLDLAAKPPKQRTRREMYHHTVDHLVARFNLESKTLLRPVAGVARITPDY
jgi:hypothetical protein